MISVVMAVKVDLDTTNVEVVDAYLECLAKLSKQATARLRDDDLPSKKFVSSIMSDTNVFDTATIKEKFNFPEA